MKKRVTIAVAVTVLSASSVFALNTPPVGAGGGVLGSVHDMNVLGGGIAKDSQGRVCAFCHTPHHAITGSDTSKADYLPLWSHTINNDTYTQYDSATYDAGSLVTDPLIGPSRLCMSCHDGQIAVDQHYGPSDSNKKTFSGNEFTGDEPQIAIGKGTDALKRTHPIGFNLALAVTRDTNGSNAGTLNFVPDLADSAKYKSGANKTIKSQLYNGTIMTCATCHDVHNKDNVANTEYDNDHVASTVNYLVFAKQAGSQLCLSCHNK